MASTVALCHHVKATIERSNAAFGHQQISVDDWPRLSTHQITQQHETERESRKRNNGKRQE
jgi:hypothetical protein